MPYSPPPGGSITLTFSSSAYSPPPGSSITLEFEPPAALQITGATAGDAALYGSPNIAQTRFIDLYTYNDGIASAEAFGSHDVDFRRVKPESVNLGELFGTQFIYLQQQFVVAESITAPLDQVTDLRVRDAGLTYLDNLPSGGALELEFIVGYAPPPGGYLVLEFNPSGTPTIRTTGIPSLVQFGVASVGMVPRLSPTGIPMGDIGEATIFNLNRTLVVPGIASDEGFGHLQVIDQRQYVSVAGVYEGGAGKPYVENLNRTVYPSRIDPEGVGSPTLIGPRYVQASGANESAVGDHVVVGPRYLYATYVQSYEFGGAIVSLGTRYVPVHGIPPVYDYVPEPAIENTSLVIEAAPPEWGSDAMGWPVIGFEPFEVIWEASAGGGEEFGEPEVDMIGATRRILQRQSLHPLQSYAVGSPRVLPHTIHPGYIPPGSFGNGGVIGPEKFGKPMVSNWIRYIDLNNGNKGIAGSRYGKPWVSNWIRYLDPKGFDRSVVWWDFGDPLLAGRVYNEYAGRVEPDGLASPGFGAPTITIRLC